MRCSRGETKGGTWWDQPSHTSNETNSCSAGPNTAACQFSRHLIKTCVRILKHATWKIGNNFLRHGETTERQTTRPITRRNARPLLLVFLESYFDFKVDVRAVLLSLGKSPLFP